MKFIDPGHVYELGNQLPEIAENSGPQTLRFIKKEKVKTKLQTVMNGSTTEQVLEACAHRLSFLHEKLPDEFTKAARYFVGQAIHALNDRTDDRKKRKVEGTDKK